MQRPSRSYIAEVTGIRPSLWVAAAVLLGGAAFVVHQALAYDPLASARAERREADARDARHGSSEPGSRHARDHGSSGPSRARSAGGYVRHDWSTESELSRRVALGLPQPGFWRDPPQHVLEHDPQLAAMWRSFQSMRDPEAESPPLPFEPTAHRAQLVDAEGAVSTNPTSCDVRVLPVESAPFNCLVRVTCDGAILYPNERQDAGYVPCDVQDGRPIRALDDGQTDRDGDPLVDLDLAGGTVTVEDYAPDGQRRYRATLRINS